MQGQLCWLSITAGIGTAEPSPAATHPSLTGPAVPGDLAPNAAAGLTIIRLHVEPQAQVVFPIHQPVVAGGRDIEDQPALGPRAQVLGVQQEQVGLPGKRGERNP